jgi:single-strand DNA-binding protein
MSEARERRNGSTDVANETVITVVGNLVEDPSLKFTPSGAGVANFTVASTPRTLDRASGEWRDGEPLFLRCSAWRDMAEHIAESLTKGARVIVQGRLRQRSYETKEGDKRTVYELEVDEIGPSLRWAQATVTRTGGDNGGRSGGFGSRGGAVDRGPHMDLGPGRGSAGSFDDEPPF